MGDHFFVDIFHRIDLKRIRVENVSKKEIASRIMKKKLGIYLRCLLLIFALNILTAYLEAFVNFDIMKKILQ